MLFGLLAVVAAVVTGHLLWSALDRPLAPIPQGTDPAYLVIPASLLGFVAVASAAHAMGMPWEMIGTAIHDVISNMFAIV